MLHLLGQLLKFMKHHKKYWIAPVMLGVLLLGALLVAVQGSPLSPFIYAIF